MASPSPSPSPSNGNTDGNASGLPAFPQFEIMEGPSQAAIDEALEKFKEGKNLFFDDQFHEATEIFSEVAKVLTDAYGDIAEELAEVYYFYGEALLNIARNSADIFGSAVAQSIAEKAAAAGEDGEDNEEDENDEEGEDQDDEEEVNGDENEEKGEGEGIDGGDDDGNEENEDEDEEVEEEEGEIGESALLDAWELLDLARVCIENSQEEKNQVLLADIRMSLGHVAFESDNLDGALEEFEKSMEIRKALTNNVRFLAEGYYLIGASLCMVPEKIDFARENLQEARKLISSLHDSTTEEEEKEGLAMLIKDIDEKIEETTMVPIEEEEGAAADLLRQSPFAQETAVTTTGFRAPVTADAPVVDLGVLGAAVKRKRSDDDSAQKEATKVARKEE